jgi:hypothetical protein
MVFVTVYKVNGLMLRPHDILKGAVSASALTQCHNI